MGFSAKMMERLKILQDLTNQGLKREEIRNFLMKSKGWKKDKFYRTWNSFIWGTVVSHSRPFSPLKKIKKYLQKNRECYFCKEKKVIEHHVSYNPERIIYLCDACHSKQHEIIETYHINNKEKDEKINFYEKLLKDIQSKINFAVFEKESEIPKESERETDK